MNKNQKILLGVAVVGVAGYYYWKSQQPKKAFVGANGSLFAGRADKPLFAQAAGGYANFKDEACMCHTGTDQIAGKTIYLCGDGQHVSDQPSVNGKCGSRKSKR